MIHVETYKPADPRLGRHVEHDERSRGFALLPKDAQPKGITTHWPSPYPPLQQGAVGSCTGNAACQWLNTQFAAPTRAKTHASKPFTEADALHLYSLATHLDSFPGVYPPADTGSSGLGVCKAGVQLGYFTAYSWLFSFTSLQAALEHGPVIAGTLWTRQMMKPFNGLVSVGSLSRQNVAGGHEYLLCGIEYGGGSNVVVARNSWGDQDSWPGCKPGGYFAISFADMAALLAHGGDLKIPTGAT